MKANKNYKVFLAENLPYSEVSPESFYRTLFPHGTLGAIPGEGESLHAKLVLKNSAGCSAVHVYDDLTPLLANRASVPIECYLSPIAYNSNERAWRCHAIVLDLCCFKKKMQVEDAFDPIIVQKMLSAIDRGTFPRPTYIVNTGHGYQFYFVFESPLPLYRKVKKELQAAKNELFYKAHRAVGRDSEKCRKKPDTIYQQYSVVGTQCKYGGTFDAFKTGGLWTVASLNEFLPHKARIKSLFPEATHSREEARDLYPGWYHRRIEQGRKNKTGRSYFIVRTSLFRWWCRRVSEDGNPEFGPDTLFCTAVMAAKSGVNWDVAKPEIEKQMALLQVDAGAISLKGLQKIVDNGSYRQMSIDKLEELTGIHIDRNKRNGRTQKEHLTLLAATSAKNVQIFAWRQERPDGTRKDCAKETCISYKTVCRWWDWQPGDPVVETQADKLAQKREQVKAQMKSLVRTDTGEITDEAAYKALAKELESLRTPRKSKKVVCPICQQFVCMISNNDVQRDPVHRQTTSLRTLTCPSCGSVEKKSYIKKWKAIDNILFSKQSERKVPSADGRAV